MTRTAGGWHSWTSFGGLGGVWVWTSPSTEQVFLWNGERHVGLVDFNDPVGVTTPFNLGCSTGATIVEKGGTLQIDSGCADVGVSTIAFARGIGPVRYVTETFAGPVFFELTAGRPQESGVPRVRQARLSDA